MMPIQTVDIAPVSQTDFHDIDYRVMEQGFAAQNSLGRFYDESICRNELARLCRAAGFESVETEVPIHVSHKDFSHTYYMDLLINRSVIYELKTVRAFDGSHRRQLLNYLFLCGLRHGKLMNFRTPRMTHEFVSTSVGEDERFRYRICVDRWRECSEASLRLKKIVEDLLKDWGVFLNASLYTDALVHFFGGESVVEKPIDIRVQGELIGCQKIRMLDETSAFFVTAVPHKNDYWKHLVNVLDKTSLKTIHWVNFDKHNVEFVTVL
jgi:GxxExxY protein